MRRSVKLASFRTEFCCSKRSPLQLVITCEIKVCYSIEQRGMAGENLQITCAKRKRHTSRGGLIGLEASEWLLTERLMGARELHSMTRSDANTCLEKVFASISSPRAQLLRQLLRNLSRTKGAGIGVEANEKIIHLRLHVLREHKIMKREFNKLSSKHKKRCCVVSRSGDICGVDWDKTNSHNFLCSEVSAGMEFCRRQRFCRCQLRWWIRFSRDFLSLASYCCAKVRAIAFRKFNYAPRELISCLIGLVTCASDPSTSICANPKCNFLVRAALAFNDVALVCRIEQLGAIYRVAQCDKAFRHSFHRAWGHGWRKPPEKEEIYVSGCLTRATRRDLLHFCAQQEEASPTHAQCVLIKSIKNRRRFKMDQFVCCCGLWITYRHRRGRHRVPRAASPKLCAPTSRWGRVTSLASDLCIGPHFERCIRRFYN